MVYLRIRACFYGVLVRFVCYQCEGFIERDIVPVALVAAPMGFCSIPGCVPDLYVFGMTASTGAWIGIKFPNRDIRRGCDCAVMCAGDAWICSIPGIKTHCYL